MKATFRPLRWTEPSTPPESRRDHPFKAAWESTLILLDAELYQLDAQDLVIEADFREQDIRLDGMPRADARRPIHPGVKVFFASKYGPLVYSTDSCQHWKHNVRSIALGLEALRAVDRYGVTKRGEQYTGWKAIGSGPSIPMGGKVMSRDDAARFLSEHAIESPLSGRSVVTAASILAFVDRARYAYRLAARRLHPDTGGNAADFQRLQDAKRVLDGVTS